MVRFQRIESTHRPVATGVRLARVLRGLFIAGLVAKRRRVMGKYVIGWLLGVPVIVLVIIYILMN